VPSQFTGEVSVTYIWISTHILRSILTSNFFINCDSTTQNSSCPYSRWVSKWGHEESRSRLIRCRMVGRPCGQF